MVENGKSGISLQKVHALLALYGKTLSDLTAASSSESRIINLSSAPEALSEPGVKVFCLTKAEDPYYLGGFYLYFEPGAWFEYDHHGGVEYVLVLEGSFELAIHPLSHGPEELRYLRKGDTTIYPADSPHSFRNTSDKFSALFVVEIDDPDECPPRRYDITDN